MEIVHIWAKEKPSDKRKYGISDVPILPRHGPWPDTALESVPHNNVIALTQFLDKAIKILKVITVVGVSHDAIGSTRVVDCRLQRRAITANRNINDARALAFSNLP